ncbi:type III secretion protein HrpB2 [Paraburkholderia sp. BCC1886]|uniref:type III secretion protein HrpB2 n=1 Tax=Paraburkholderia sp. BCC1886 TaxID=2562670 RepID=UPI0011831AE2|nr:type III secretion protein HrpB2 [Paraburkholderia sp. BCC1886]
MSESIGNANPLVSAALNALEQGGDVAGAVPPAGAAEKFQALMDQPQLSPPGAHAGGDETLFTQMVSTHDAAAQAAMDHMTEFSQQAGNMDIKQVIAQSAQAAMEMYQVQFDFQAKMSVVSSSKSSAETLMKNQ